MKATACLRASIQAPTIRADGKRLTDGTIDRQRRPGEGIFKETHLDTWGRPGDGKHKQRILPKVENVGPRTGCVDSALAESCGCLKRI